MAKQKEKTAVARAKSDNLNSKNNKAGGGSGNTDSGSSGSKGEIFNEDDDVMAKVRQEDKAMVQSIIENEQEIREREQSIREIETAMREVNEIFKDLSTLVNEQGVMLTTIEDNISSSAEHVKTGKGELMRATEHQKSSRKKMCCILVIVVLVLALVIVVVFKVGNVKLPPSK